MYSYRGTVLSTRYSKCQDTFLMTNDNISNTTHDYWTINRKRSHSHFLAIGCRRHQNVVQLEIIHVIPTLIVIIHVVPHLHRVYVIQRNIHVVKCVFYGHLWPLYYVARPLSRSLNLLTSYFELILPCNTIRNFSVPLVPIPIRKSNTLSQVVLHTLSSSTLPVPVVSQKNNKNMMTKPDTKALKYVIIYKKERKLGV
jgi:hypothetical protein